MGYIRADIIYLERPLSWETEAVLNMGASLELEGKVDTDFQTLRVSI